MSKPVENLIGKRFGRLFILKWIGKGHWKCKCNCGKFTVVKTGHLKSGHTKSCGCLGLESVKQTKNVKHGFHNTEYSKGKMKFYKMWQSLKARCDNPNLKCYKNYGGRSITYDSRWKEFEEFKNDMYMKYLYASKQEKINNVTIERINVNGNYDKENCTFVDRIDQLKNTRSVIACIAISPKGEKLIIKNVNEFSKNNNLNSTHVYECLKGKANHHKGWTFKKR